jgi:hypothetical protein
LSKEDHSREHHNGRDDIANGDQQRRHQARHRLGARCAAECGIRVGAVEDGLAFAHVDPISSASPVLASTTTTGSRSSVWF